MLEASRTSETSLENNFPRQNNPEDSSEHQNNILFLLYKPPEAIT
jgi:hypothetical protein